MHLLGLGGLVAEAIDEGLKLVDFFLLIAVSSFKLGAALGFLCQVLLIVAGVKKDLLVPDLSGLFYGNVEK